MKAAGATAAVTGVRDRLKSWQAHHRRVFFFTISELLQNPLASLMSWLVIGIALALPMILYVMLSNVSMVSGEWGGKPRVNLYLAQDLNTPVARALATEISQEPGVEAVVFISSEAALKDFQRRSGFGDVLSTLDRNPLPHVIEVVPQEPDAVLLQQMMARWEVRSEVERVSVDFAWLERLFALLSFAERLVLALALVLATGVMLVLGNTIRLAIESRRQEIVIIKLVGGTDAFVRRPFLYLGFWYGFGGAVIALLLVQASLLFLAGPVETLAQSYRDDFALTGLGLAGNLLLLAGGSLLGIIGALLSVSRHLREIEPT